MCRFFSVAPSHPPIHPTRPSFLRSLSRSSSLPLRSRPLSFFLKINPKPRFRLRATNTRRYIYFFYCLAPEFPIVSRNLSLHGKFGHAEAGAFILRRGYEEDQEEEKQRDEIGRKDRINGRWLLRGREGGGKDGDRRGRGEEEIGDRSNRR